MMKLRIDANPEEKRISIEGFDEKTFLANGVLKMSAEDYQRLQELVLEVYYS